MSVKYCSNCGTRLDSGEISCPNCGEDVGEKQTNDRVAKKVDTDIETKPLIEDFDGIGWKRAGKAVAIGFIVILGVLLGLVGYTLVNIYVILPIGIVVFALFIYSEKTTKAMLSEFFFWLSVGALFSPVLAIIFLVAFDSGIFGVIIVAAGVTVGLPVSWALYMLSKIFDVDKSD